MSNSPLQRIQNWQQLAHDVKYSVKALAKACGVSVRALEMFFVAVMHESPRRWLNRLRMKKAVELLCGGSNVSEAADCLGYRDRSHFSREFKRSYGVAPKRFQLATSRGGPACRSDWAT